jgi:hypothetical protein
VSAVRNPHPLALHHHDQPAHLVSAASVLQPAKCTTALSPPHAVLRTTGAALTKVIALAAKHSIRSTARAAATRPVVVVQALAQAQAQAPAQVQVQVQVKVVVPALKPAPRVMEAEEGIAMAQVAALKARTVNLLLLLEHPALLPRVWWLVSL